jgi:hypothetical protein
MTDNNPIDYCGVVRTYYDTENTKLGVEYFRVNNKKEGIYKLYDYKTGVIIIEINYINDKKEGISREFYTTGNIFRETDDIYDKSTLDRQFYTVPSTTIPNNRELFTEWLYDRGPSCKENNGEQCYNNLYNDIKNNLHF